MISKNSIRAFRWSVPAIALDVALVVVLLIALEVEGLSDSAEFHPELALLAVPFLWRRRYPLLTFGGVFLGAIAGADTAQYVAFLCLMIATYSVGAYGRHRLLALAVFIATSIGVDAYYGGALPQIPAAWGPVIVTIPFWLIGMGMRTRLLRAEASEDRAARLEREQEQATQLALAEERSRIARELHDVLAHSVSVMLVQAGAARQVLTSSPEEAREALLAVEAGGREAMAELRSLLGLLKEEEVETELSPQPGVDQVETLVSRVREAGLPVELRVEGTPKALPAGLDLAAYRIVQEALTNSLKYSNLASTQVILGYRDDELKLEILDEGPAGSDGNGPHPGRGLVGMRERTALYGGRLEAGPRLNGGYAVRAWLPT